MKFNSTFCFPRARLAANKFAMWYLDQYGTDPPVSLVVRAVKQVRTRVRTYVRYVRTTNVGKHYNTYYAPPYLARHRVVVQ